MCLAGHVSADQGSGSIPRRYPMRTASVRFLAPSVWSTLWTCQRTVLSAIISVSAMARLGRPWARRSRIWLSCSARRSGAHWAHQVELRGVEDVGSTPGRQHSSCSPSKADMGTASVEPTPREIALRRSCPGYSSLSGRHRRYRFRRRGVPVPAPACSSWVCGRFVRLSSRRSGRRDSLAELRWRGGKGSDTPFPPAADTLFLGRR